MRDLKWPLGATSYISSNLEVNHGETENHVGGPSFGIC